MMSAALYAAARALGVLRGSLGISEMPTEVEQLPVLALVAGTVTLVLSPIANALSRLHERRADRFAIERTGNAPAVHERHQAAVVAESCRGGSTGLGEALCHSHPSTARRLEFARRFSRSMRGRLQAAHGRAGWKPALATTRASGGRRSPTRVACSKA